MKTGNGKLPSTPEDTMRLFRERKVARIERKEQLTLLKLTKGNLLTLIERERQTIDHLQGQILLQRDTIASYKGECRGLRKSLQLLTGRILPITVPTLGLTTKKGE